MFPICKWFKVRKRGIAIYGRNYKSYLMKCIYWNIRGIGNSFSKLDFKRLCDLNNPMFFFIVEPWLNSRVFSRTLLSQLIFSRGSLLNLWCLCYVN